MCSQAKGNVVNTEHNLQTLVSYSMNMDEVKGLKIQGDQFIADELEKKIAETELPVTRSRSGRK